MSKLSVWYRKINPKTEVESVDVKGGVKTTEFWITTALSLWTLLSGTVPAPYSVIIPAVVSGLYIITRGLVKGGILKGDLKKYVDNNPE